MVSVTPDTVHTAVVVDVNVTGSPEDAVAERVIGVVPNGTLLSDPNEMVCGPCTTVKPCVTDVAGR